MTITEYMATMPPWVHLLTVLGVGTIGAIVLYYCCKVPHIGRLEHDGSQRPQWQDAAQTVATHASTVAGIASAVADVAGVVATARVATPLIGSLFTTLQDVDGNRITIPTSQLRDYFLRRLETATIANRRIQWLAETGTVVRIFLPDGSFHFHYSYSDFELALSQRQAYEIVRWTRPPGQHVLRYPEPGPTFDRRATPQERDQLVQQADLFFLNGGDNDGEEHEEDTDEDEVQVPPNTVLHDRLLNVYRWVGQHGDVIISARDAAERILAADIPGYHWVADNGVVREATYAERMSILQSARLSYGRERLQGPPLGTVIYNGADNSWWLAADPEPTSLRHRDAMALLLQAQPRGYHWVQEGVRRREATSFEIQEIAATAENFVGRPTTPTHPDPVGPPPQQEPRSDAQRAAPRLVWDVTRHTWHTVGVSGEMLNIGEFAALTLAMQLSGRHMRRLEDGSLRQATVSERQRVLAMARSRLIGRRSTGGTSPEPWGSLSLRDRLILACVAAPEGARLMHEVLEPTEPDHPLQRPQTRELHDWFLTAGFSRREYESVRSLFLDDQLFVAGLTKMRSLFSRESTPSRPDGWRQLDLEESG